MLSHRLQFVWNEVKIMYVIIVSLEVMFALKIDDYKERKIHHSLLCPI
jgi:hypothetical protein